MKAIEEFADRRYGMYVLTDEDPDSFRERLAKRERSLSGLPVRLSDGRQVGIARAVSEPCRVRSRAVQRWPDPPSPAQPDRVSTGRARRGGALAHRSAGQAPS